MRRSLDWIVWRLSRVLVHVFFCEIEVTGESIPRGAPLMLVANHTNSVVDAVLLLSLSVARPRLLAKSPLFSHPVMAPLLALAGALPVYRREDPGADPARNFETFARCCDALGAGSSIAMFPEGTSHNEPRPLPLKTGAARIVLQASARQPLGVRIVPVGLRYDAKDRFRSRVRVQIGSALDPAPELARYRAEPRRAVRALTDRIATGLRAAVSDAELRPLAPAAGSAACLRLTKNPLFALGLALNWLPYRAPGWLSARLATRPDEPATYKLLAGLWVFPMVWAAETLMAVLAGGALCGLAMAVAAPASGYAALRIWERSGGR